MLLETGEGLCKNMVNIVKTSRMDFLFSALRMGQWSVLKQTPDNDNRKTLEEHLTPKLCEKLFRLTTAEIAAWDKGSAVLVLGIEQDGAEAVVFEKHLRRRHGTRHAFVAIKLGR